MLKAVLDTTVLVSAFLNPNPGGAAFELSRFAKERRFELHASNEILEELYQWQQAMTLFRHPKVRPPT